MRPIRNRECYWLNKNGGVRRLRLQEDNGLWFGLDTPTKHIFEVGLGNALFIRGYCFHQIYEMEKLNIFVGSEKYKVFNYGLPREDVLNQFMKFEKQSSNSFMSGFTCVVPVERLKEDRIAELSIEAVLSNGVAIREKLLDINFKQKIFENCFTELAIAQNSDKIKKSHSGPHVAICMAVYNQNNLFLKNQIDSIKAQSYENWICIINDDFSTLDNYKELLEIVGDDERFVIFRNSENLGFYHNFEKLLRMVPPQADFIALSDQDDFWYKEKIERCISEFDPETNLVYSDMRIVDHEGICIFPTFWTTRRNYFEELDYLILANTITGAASVFRRSLIEYILPFPERIGDSFHDHWIACVANAIGKIKYINESLYDYYQHSSNVLGQYLFVRNGFKDYLRIFYELLNWNKDKERLLSYQRDFNIDGMRLHIIALCLALRIENIDSKKRGELSKFLLSEKYSRSMIAMKVKSLMNRKTTNNAELRLFCFYWANRILRSNFFRRRRTKQISKSFIRYSYNDIKNKIAPLRLAISDKNEEYINLLVPSIDFRYFFGGYIAKFNLAKKLVETGYSVRIILVDQSSIDLEVCKNEIRKYPGLEDFFDFVEIFPAGERSKELSVSPQDVFIATTWWTAHIANAAVLQHVGKKFLYLIQEFEPFTFPMGTYYALAMQSYCFPHYAIFSTGLLQEYFRINKIGVYDEKIHNLADNDAIYFENAVKEFDIDISSMKNRKIKKLLFYARPEDHAARNMFDLGMIALQEAINRGVLKAHEWKIYGIGSIRPDKFYPLTDDINITILPKVPLAEYYESLPKFDLGLCLMYTPHPSLPPLDMAAARLIVVTNTCLNKTEEKLNRISENIIGVSPTVEGIVAGLKRGASLVNDYELRIEGSHINWANDWKNAFDDLRINKIKEFIRKSKS